MFKSMVITSGFKDSDRAIASRPSLAWPMTWSWLSALKMDSKTLRMKAESSTTSTRNFFGAALTMAVLSHRHDGACRLRSHQLFDGSQELVFLHRLGEEGGSSFFQGAIAVFCAGTGSHDHHRNALGGGALPQLGHEFIAGHARHFKVRNHQVAAVLSNKFGGFQAVGSQLGAVAVLFQHAADEFAHADG